jgi:glyoxylase-like metal-dependent hydrolase (beta-lactamase superfamily II)/ferredoxin
MADARRRLPQNVAGDFFVDDTCIDCDTCRAVAPETFRDHGAQSSVHHQPAAPDERRRALRALVACPTGSIGTVAHAPDVGDAVASFPERIADDVYFCGFTSEKTFGGWSYLVRRAPERGGNVLVDSPRFTAPLVRQIRALGGVSVMLLTHKDDTGDHAAFTEEFRGTRVMHVADGAARLGAERVIDGVKPARLDDDVVAIPTPGHTRGHTVFLYRETFLFAGDHVAWSPERGTLIAWPDVCWYSWPEQTRSMERLREHRFVWVSPGLGRIHHAPAAVMRANLDRCIARMKQQRGRGAG